MCSHATETRRKGEPAPRAALALSSLSSLVLATLAAVASSALVLPPHRPRPSIRPSALPHLRMSGPSTSSEDWAVREPIDLTKWAVAGSAAATVLYRHDLASVLCVGGAIGNALLSKVLKRLITKRTEIVCETQSLRVAGASTMLRDDLTLASAGVVPRAELHLVVDASAEAAPDE